MIYKKFEGRLLLRVLLLFGTLCAEAFLLAGGQYLYCLLMLPLIGYQVVELVRFHRKTQLELEQFVESVHYRDFSRYFDVKNAPVELQPLREGFNEINTTFRVISKERETQYHYLQKILELVGTGILSYGEEDGTVMWMNESLKKLLHLPYLKTIHSLKKRDEELYHELLSLAPGDSKVATAHVDQEAFKVLISATGFAIEGRTFKLVAFQNVHEALDETESKAWQKLLSVMTHEIMNSVAPISSLAETLRNRLQRSATTITNASTFEDLEVGIDTIKRRSEGLLKFAETYRSLNKITSLNLQTVHVRELFGNLYRLMEPTFEQKGIEVLLKLPEPDLSLQADASLLEQVLINLVVNAIEAVKEEETPRIVLSASGTLGKKVIIKVADNGAGMPEEVLEKIFIPFFSTKKQGSGIGLSLCKQIVLLHKGTISVQSAEGRGTVFSMQFG